MEDKNRPSNFLATVLNRTGSTSSQTASSSSVGASVGAAVDRKLQELTVAANLTRSLSTTVNELTARLDTIEKRFASSLCRVDEDLSVTQCRCRDVLQQATNLAERVTATAEMNSGLRGEVQRLEEALRDAQDERTALARSNADLNAAVKELIDVNGKLRAENEEAHTENARLSERVLSVETGIERLRRICADATASSNEARAAVCARINTLSKHGADFESRIVSIERICGLGNCVPAEQVPESVRAWSQHAAGVLPFSKSSDFTPLVTQNEVEFVTSQTSERWDAQRLIDELGEKQRALEELRLSIDDSFNAQRSGSVQKFFQKLGTSQSIDRLGTVFKGKGIDISSIGEVRDESFMYN